MAKESAVAPTTFLPPEQSRELFLVLARALIRAECPALHPTPSRQCPVPEVAPYWTP